MPVAEVAAKILGPFNFRGKARLLNSLCPREGTRRRTLFGFEVELSMSDFIERNVYLGTYEPADSALVREHLAPGMTVIDVGANIGYYSLMAAAVVGPTGRVFSFEPNPGLCQHLERTISENQIKNITLEKSGVSDEPGWAELFVPNMLGNNSASMIANEGGRPVRVPIVSLDEYIDEHGIERIDFMKIDVEGFEPKVIKGCRSAIRAGRVRALLCEFNREWLKLGGTTPKDCYEEIRSLGLKPTVELAGEHLALENILFIAQ